VIPPARLTAWTPTEPSESPPESTTAIALSPEASASDLKRASTGETVQAYSASG
jgi:hypothetical protein